MNVYDSQKMADLLAPWGYQNSPISEDADIVIVNTCHIREKASEKLYSDLGRLHKIKKQRQAEGKDQFLIVAGCVAQAHGAEVHRQAPFVDLVVGPQAYHQIPVLLSQAQRQKEILQNNNIVKPGMGIIATDFPIESKFDHLPDSSQRSGPSALLTIQEGCDRYCSYCVVTYTRGAEYSRPVDDVLKEAKQLVQNGARELVLLGQNVNAYHGVKQNKIWGLGALIEELEQMEGLHRIRYTTSHPTDMTDDLIAVHGRSQKLSLLLHLPIQSGSDAVLKAMNRRHTVAQYLERIDKIKNAQPKIRFSTDIIIGHPGETDKDFEDTLAVYKQVGYVQSYSFKFSPRPGTPSAIQLNQVDESIKDERLAIFQALALEQQKQFNQHSHAQIIPVLYDKIGHRAGQLMGKTTYGQSVHVEANPRILGHILNTKITSSTASSLTGEIITFEHDSVA